MSAAAWRLDDRNLGTGLLVAAAVVLVVVSAADAAQGIHERWTASVFLAAIAIGELIRIRLPGDREAAPLGAAFAMAYAVAPDWRDASSHTPVSQVVLVTTVAVLIGVFPHFAAGRTVQVESLARRILMVAVASALFRLEPVHLPLADNSSYPQITAVWLVLIVAVTLVADAVLAAATRAGRHRAPFRKTLRNELRASTGISSAIGATGILIALATTAMGEWALLVFAVPLLLAQFSFRRYAAIRATYLQTIRALSRVTEVGGYTESGHSRRVSRLAVAVGTELGMSEEELLDLEYAALMHDIGQLSLTDPIPGGATVVVEPEEQRRIAHLGAGVVRQTGVLDEVATIVERQAEPYRRKHQTGDRTVPMASRIIKVANAYDDLVGDAVEDSRRADAVERLRLGTDYEYDPRVVASLARVLERSSRG